MDYEERNGFSRTEGDENRNEGWSNRRDGEDRNYDSREANGERRPFRPRYNNDGDQQQRPFRPRFNNDGDQQQRPFRPRYNDEQGEQRPFRPRYNNDGEQQQRPFRPRYNNDGDQQQRPFRPRYNNDEQGEQRPFRPRYNNDEQGEQRPFRPRYNNDGDQQQRPFRPRYNNDEQGEQRPFRPRYNNDGEQQQRPFRPRYNNDGEQQQRPFRPRYNNEGDQQQRPFRPRYNNDGDQQQRPFRPRYNNDGEQQQRPFRPRYNNDGEQQQRPFRPRFNNGEQQQGGFRRGGDRRQQGGAPRGGRRPFQKESKFSANRLMRDQRGPRYKVDYKLFDGEDEMTLNGTDPEMQGMPETLRLNRFIAMSGVCSRREADELIKNGSIKVNDQVVTEMGVTVSKNDKVEYDGKVLKAEKKVYVLLNKPKDAVTTTEDPEGRRTVMDIVANAAEERIYPVGRLDRNTTGLLLLTNDGDMAEKLMHPRYEVRKIYHVFLDKHVREEDMQAMLNGIELEDGPIKVDEVSYVDMRDRKQVGVVIHSGRNRIVRRIFEHLGYDVEKLDRVYYGGLTKLNVPRGHWRYLTDEEVNRLKAGFVK